MPTQYDAIGEQYAQVKAMPQPRYAEEYSLLRSVQPLAGLAVLDVACGTGHYCRLWKTNGAGRVVGVDVSAAMVEVAESYERQAQQGIEYVVGDAADLPDVGQFDLITASWLLHYAETKDQLRRFCASLGRSLLAGGRVVALTPNPHFSFDKPQEPRYAGVASRRAPAADGSASEYRFTSTPLFSITYHHWSQATYEWALREAGLHAIRWVPVVVSPEGLERFGAEFWQNLFDNPFPVVLTAEKKR